jgi:hypothetical protein
MFFLRHPYLLQSSPGSRMWKRGLTANQSTTCRIYFKAFGSGTVQLSCNETKYQDTNWTSGQIYSTNFVECAKTNLSITPSEISAAS